MRIFAPGKNEIMVIKRILKNHGTDKGAEYQPLTSIPGNIPPMLNQELNLINYFRSVYHSKHRLFAARQKQITVIMAIKKIMVQTGGSGTDEA
jgi:hypothetical protein